MSFQLSSVIHQAVKKIQISILKATFICKREPYWTISFNKHKLLDMWLFFPVMLHTGRKSS